MSSFPERQDEVIPIDVYAAIQRQFLLDPETISKLRRSHSFSGLAPDEAGAIVNRLLDVFGPHLTKQLLVNGRLHAHRLVSHVEPRAALLMNAGASLTQSDVLRMMVRETNMLACDDMTFTALLDCAARLVPDRGQRGIFLYAFPQYFSLPPVTVSGYLASKRAKRFANDQLALWKDLSRVCAKRASPLVSTRSRTELEAAPPLDEALTAPAADLKPLTAPMRQPRTPRVASSRTQPLPAPRTAAERIEMDAASSEQATPAPDDRLTSHAASAEDHKPAPHAELTALFARLGYPYVRRERLAFRAMRHFGSWQAALIFVARLSDAGWTRRFMTEILSHGALRQPLEIERLIGLERVLKSVFGLDPSFVRRLLVERTYLHALAPEDLEQRIRAALGTPTVSGLSLFLRKAGLALKMDAAWLARRRSQLEALGLEPEENPTFFLRAHIEERTRTLKAALAARRGRASGSALSSDRADEQRNAAEERDPVSDGADQTDQKLEPSADHTRRSHARDESQKALVKALLTDLTTAGHSLKRQQLERRLRANVLRILAVRQELRAMERRLLGYPAFRTAKPCPASPDLPPREAGSRFAGLSAQPRRSRAPVAQPSRLTRELEREASQIAQSVSRTTPHDLADVLAALHEWGYTRSDALHLLRQHPELLALEARPLAIVNEFERVCGLRHCDARKQLTNERELAVLFEDPAVFGFERRIKALRRVDTDFETLGLDPSLLDFTRYWSRLYMPAEELAWRLRHLTQTDLVLSPDSVHLLFLPARADFLRRCTSTAW